MLLDFRSPLKPDNIRTRGTPK